MTEYVHCVFVKHNYCGKPFLFCVDDNNRLRSGQKVLCNTKNGESKGVCFGDSFMLSKYALKQVAQAVGATLPLKEVTGIIELKPVMQEMVTRFNELPF